MLDTDVHTCPNCIGFILCSLVKLSHLMLSATSIYFLQNVCNIISVYGDEIRINNFGFNKILQRNGYGIRQFWAWCHTKCDTTHQISMKLYEVQGHIGLIYTCQVILFVEISPMTAPNFRFLKSNFDHNLPPIVKKVLQ